MTRFVCFSESLGFSNRILSNICSLLNTDLISLVFQKNWHLKRNSWRWDEVTVISAQIETTRLSHKWGGGAGCEKQQVSPLLWASLMTSRLTQVCVSRLQLQHPTLASQPLSLSPRVTPSQKQQAHPLTGTPTHASLYRG